MNAPSNLRVAAPRLPGRDADPRTSLLQRRPHPPFRRPDGRPAGQAPRPASRGHAPDPSTLAQPPAFGAPSLALVPRIVVADGDPAMRTRLAEFLDGSGMRVATASDGRELEEQVAAQPSLIVLDRQLGHEDGLELLRGIRRMSDVPVIITAGHGPDEIDRILGLELGADDYLVKPFSLRELLARVRCVLRRITVAPEAERRRPQRRVRFGPWELDRLERRLTREGAPPVDLTKGEYALLHAFLDAPHRPLSREHLLHATRIHEDVFDRSIDVKILRLRRKLETDPGAPQVIETLRGVGYVFRAVVEVV